MKLSEHVSFIGVHNSTMRIFDIIMRTGYGTSYNSYLVKGKEYAIIETVQENYLPEYLEKIENEVDIKDVKYIVLNHTEPDHSGCLRKLLEMNPDIIVYGTSAAIRNIGAIINMEFHSQVVRMGDKLDLGDGVVLEFIPAPNLHWPDSMFTYIAADKMLFTCDFLGCHFCEPMVLDTHVKEEDKYLSEVKNYFECIMSPFKKFVNAGLEKIKDLDFEMVGTSHGPVLKKYLKQVLEDYKVWANEEKKEKNIAIFYVSAYGYTKRMASIFEEVFEAHGVKTKSYDLLEYSLEEQAEAMNKATAVLFGSPTINRDAVLPVWDLITKTEVINVQHKPALAFGSYGWGGEACAMLMNRLESMSYNVYPEGIRCHFNPSQEEEEKIREAAVKFLEMCN